MTTLVEVARAAGVTAATVSNVLRNRGKVGEEKVELTRDPVRDARRLGDRDLRQSRCQPHQREAISAIVTAVSRVVAMSTHSSIPWIAPALGP